jgi:hypothetical protein
METILKHGTAMHKKQANKNNMSKKTKDRLDSG